MLKKSDPANAQSRVGERTRLLGAPMWFARHNFLFGPGGAISRPGRSLRAPARAAAVKTGPAGGRRRLGLEGREHDGTLADKGRTREVVAGASVAAQRALAALGR
jgi:hypothetical protein